MDPNSLSPSRKMPADEGACIICLDTSPPPIQSGCACRGDSGLAHIACLGVRAAASQQAQRGNGVWKQCQTSRLYYTGAMQTGLAEAWRSRVADQAAASGPGGQARRMGSESRTGRRPWRTAACRSPGSPALLKPSVLARGSLLSWFVRELVRSHCGHGDPSKSVTSYMIQRLELRTDARGCTEQIDKPHFQALRWNASRAV